LVIAAFFGTLRDLIFERPGKPVSTTEGISKRIWQVVLPWSFQLFSCLGFRFLYYRLFAPGITASALMLAQKDEASSSMVVPIAVQLRMQ